MELLNNQVNSKSKRTLNYREKTKTKTVEAKWNYSSLASRLRICLDWTYFCWNWKLKLKKLLKSEICGSVISAWVQCSPWKSQHLRLLFINSALLQKCVKKKKKKGTFTACNYSVDPIPKTQTLKRSKTSKPNGY